MWRGARRKKSSSPWGTEDSFQNRTKTSLTKDSSAFAIETVIGRFSQREDIAE